MYTTQTHSHIYLYISNTPQQKTTLKPHLHQMSVMKMSVTLSSLFLSLFLAIHSTNAFNITEILDKYSDFSSFNSYLSQTNLASEINRRQALTVLAVENSNLSPLSGKSLSLVKSILSVHVVLDYYDVAKLQSLSKTSLLLTTLFQTTGQAKNNQGFINVTKLGTDSVALGSAAPGSPLGSNLVKTVSSQPYNISVVQVSNVIVPPGIDGSGRSPAPTRGPSVSPPAPPSPPKPDSEAPTPTPSKARAPTKSASPAPTKSASPAPTPAPAPAIDSNLGDNVADAPALGELDEVKADPPSAGKALQIGLAVVFVMVISTLYLASRI